MRVATLIINEMHMYAEREVVKSKIEKYRKSMVDHMM